MSAAGAAGLVLALGSTAALNWGFFNQHSAAGGMPPLSIRRPLASLRRLGASRRWLAGFFVGLAGWALYIAALKLAPLSLVQAVSAGGLGLLALLQWVTPGSERPSHREWTAVAVAVAGLVLLAVSLAGNMARGTAPPLAETVFWVLLLALAAGAVAGSAWLGVPAAAALGAAAGILYATGDIATKEAVATATLLLVPIVLVAHGLAFVSLQLGFQQGGVLVTVGLATLLMNALPIAAGAALFRERLPAGVFGDLRLLAFGLVIAGAALLARPVSRDRAAVGPPRPAPG